MHRSGRRSCRFRWQIDRHWWIIHRRRNSPDVLNKKHSPDNEIHGPASTVQCYESSRIVVWTMDSDDRIWKRAEEKVRRKQSIKVGAIVQRRNVFFFGMGRNIRDRKAAGAVAGLSLTCAWLFQESIFRFVEFTEIHFRNRRGSRD